MYKKLLEWTITTLGHIHWTEKNLIDEYEQHEIKNRLRPDYYIILTRRNSYFSTYMIAIANFFLTGKFGHWSHVLMNLEDEVPTDDDFQLIEAISNGVTISPFGKVFNVNSVALLKPTHMPLEKWTSVLDQAKTELGKPYDTLSDLKSDKEINCVELVRIALRNGDPEYHLHFAKFEEMIAKEKYLTPQMFYDCPDFEVVFEVKRR